MLNFFFGVISGILLSVFLMLLIVRIVLVVQERYEIYSSDEMIETLEGQEKMTRGFDKLARKCVDFLEWFLIN